MSELLQCKQSDGVTRIVMDDGKANVMSSAMLEALSRALDQAETYGGVVILQGRTGMFSGGFDLNVFKTGSRREKINMLKAGAEITERLLGYPMPSIAACTGHAIAMGAFLLLSCDYRLGAKGSFKFAANEVAIGLTVPRFAVTVCRQRLTPAALNQGLALAHYFDTASARQAGFLDELVAPDMMENRVQEIAAQCNKLDMEAHRATKLRLREDLLDRLHRAIKEDNRDWQANY